MGKLRFLLSTFLLVLLGMAPVSARQFNGLSIATLEDFDDILTQQDLGFNDFSGNMGFLNELYIVNDELICDGGECQFHIGWDFGLDTEVFTGYFMSLFGLTDTMATFDGTTVVNLPFPEHFINLDQIDGSLNVPARAFTTICSELTYQGAESLALRLELKDVDDGIRFHRVTVNPAAAPQTICWDFRSDFSVPAGQTEANLARAKVFALVIEESNVAAGINNPTSGQIDLDHIYFTLDTPESRPATNDEYAELAARRAYQYFLDWSSRDSRSRNLPQDRSTFADLLSMGGVGFAIPAHIIAADNGWISRAEAAQRVHDILNVINEGSFGDDSVGHIGYRGWFYHFLGVDGNRKLNFDFEATPGIDESLNTVELSSIDTGLAVIGVLAAQSYFTETITAEVEIRTMAQAIYDRVEWDFMLEADREQFYLGWKPNEEYEGPPFELPDADNLGNYSGIPGQPATLDFYTDEALILILLAAGSTTHPVDPALYTRLYYAADSDGFIRTFPGALFTYQFLPAFVDTGGWPASCMGVDWHANAREAISRTIDYAANSGAYATYGADAWGISAAEGPFDDYHAYGAPDVAVANDPEEDGTVTYYGMASAAGLHEGGDLFAPALAAIASSWDRDHWHPRFGLPDAFHTDVSEAPELPDDLLRASGAWQGRAIFAIDNGPMLLHLENARSGLIWRLLAANPNVQRAYVRMRAQGILPLGLQGEGGSGDGVVMSRSRAWGDQTVLLQAGESRQLPFNTTVYGEDVTIFARYSNDNGNGLPSEQVEFLLDGVSAGSFEAMDTGDSGAGWNLFAFSPAYRLESVGVGDHTLTISVSGGDGFGVEIDIAFVNVRYQTECDQVLHLPAVSRP